MGQVASRSRFRMTFGNLLTWTTFLVTLVALVPAFLALNKDQPRLYYSVTTKSYSPPEEYMQQAFLELLRKFNMPASRCEICVINSGNAPAKEARLLIKAQGSIVRTQWNPPKEAQEVWVDTPENREFGFGGATTRVSDVIHNMATNRKLTILVGYESATGDPPHIELYADGQAAERIANIGEAPEWNPYRVFYLPGAILALGVILSILWSLISVIRSNVKYQVQLAELLRGVARTMVETVAMF